MTELKKWKYRLSKPWLSEVEKAAVLQVMDSGWLAEGEETARFERKVAEYVGAKHAVAVSNCTVAMELAIKAQNFHGEIAVPAFGHPATVQAVLNAGCHPAFIDVDLERYVSTCKQIPFEAPRTLPVSWGGSPATTYFNPVVEDAACSLGARDGEFKVGGAWSHPTCFSFHPRKLVTCGEGGMVTTNNEKLVERIRELKSFGPSGGNYKLDDVRASIGCVQMDRIEEIIGVRIRMAKVYDDLLSTVIYNDNQVIKPPIKRSGVRHTYQTYAVYLENVDRNKVMIKLRDQGIEVQIGAYALHKRPGFENLRQIGSLENSEKLADHLLALPMAYDLSEEDQKSIIDELSKAVNS